MGHAMGGVMCVKGHHMGGVMRAWVITWVRSCMGVTHLIMGPPILGRGSQRAPNPPEFAQPRLSRAK